MTSVTFSGSENHNEGSQSAFCSFPMPGESMEAYTARAKAYTDINSVYDNILHLKRTLKITFVFLAIGHLTAIGFAVYALVKLWSL